MTELNPARILRDLPKAPEGTVFGYEFADPAAPIAKRAVVYAGVDPAEYTKFAANTLGIGMGFLEPPKARWLAGLLLHAILPETPRVPACERPAPELIPLRNELAAAYASKALKEYVSFDGRHQVAGVESGWTFAQLYQHLGRREPNRWQLPQRKALAVMLAEPNFNALLLTKFVGWRVDETFCLDDNPTLFSMDKVIDYLNRYSVKSTNAYSDIYSTYKFMKGQFVRSLLMWAEGTFRGHALFGSSFEEVYESHPYHYRPAPPTHATQEAPS